MNDPENLKAYIESYKTGMENKYSLELPDFVDYFVDKYSTKLDGSDSNTILESLNDDMNKFIANILLDKEREAKVTNEEEQVVEQKQDDAVMVDLDDATVNLMMIAKANTPEELREVIGKVPNLDFALKDINITDKEFETIRQQVFDKYKSSLSEDLNNSGLGLNTIDEYRAVSDNSSDVIVEDEEELLENEEAIEIPKEEKSEEVKEEPSEISDVNIMFDEDQNDMTKEVEDNQVEDKGRSLKITPPSEKGFAYSPAINITVLLLLIFFFIVICTALLK